jgi:cytoskeleton protein RodZ
MTGDTAGQPHAHGPGVELARERERQGLTQQQVAEQLNLDVSVINWIENDEYAALGAPVFARGHLRRYSTLLGLPPDRVLAEYARAETQPAQPTLIPKAREDRVPVRPRTRWPWVLGAVAGSLLVAALIAFVAERWSNWRGPSPSTGAVAPAAPAARDAAESTPSQAPAATVAPDEPATGEEAATAPAAAAGGGEITLQLAFSADTWVEVYDGSGTPVLYDLGGRGTERTLRATPPLSITIGDPGSVTVHANGRRLSVPAAPTGQSLTRFSIDADGAVR